ncbi:MAG TPA: aminotransferase class V-fold PLP-dependent enzyme [Geobacterales bacterium]|nr:aminotransferase class V-fold PLP-dependent enzyme [Geobacterales bacterium]
MSVYLDNAATSFPKPEAVYSAVDHALRHIGVSPGRSGHRQGIEASRLVFACREKAARLFGIVDSSRLIFTHSATESLNLAVTGLLNRGDHVVTTTMEHNSLARPLRRFAAQGGRVTWVAANGEGVVSPLDLAAAMEPTTRLVALAHSSNVTGTVQPLAEIGAITSQRGVRLLVDAAQSAGILPIDVSSLAIDLLAVPGHKGLLGPAGTGLLYVAPGITLRPLMVGGTGGGSSSSDQPVELPEGLESGTLNLPGIAGLAAALDFILEQGVESIGRKESRLVARLVEGLSLLPGVTVHGPADISQRCGVVSFTVDGRDPSEIGMRLDQEYDIAVRVGLHCAPDAHRTIGTYPTGTVRLSPGYFTTDSDIEELLKAMKKIVGEKG